MARILQSAPTSPTPSTGGARDLSNPSVTPIQTPDTTPTPDLGTLDANQLQGAGQKIVSSVTRGAQKLQQDVPGQGLAGIGKGALDLGEAGLGTAAGAVQGIFAPVTAVLQKVLGNAKTPSITAPPPGSTGLLTPGIHAIQAWAQKHPEAAQNLMDAVTVGGAALGGNEGILGKEAANTTVGDALSSYKQAGTDIVKGATSIPAKVPGAVNSVVSGAKDLLGGGPKLPAEAAGQIVQGTSKDVAPAIKALSLIDTTGVRTYADLSQQLSKKIPLLSRVVDNQLAQDTTVYTLKNLMKNAVSSNGETISTDYVSRALKNLSELYATTGEDVAKANIDSLLKTAQEKGLTRQAVNNISRKYNTEFGDKAFSPKTGDPLTSVNAQQYENTRSGLKDIARAGLGGTGAATADEALTHIYNTKRLVDKVGTQVTKLQQKIDTRGLGAQIGHAVTKYGDLLTGGVLRGAVGGLLPRGVGNKVLNALDLEDNLKRNLQLLTTANSATTNAQFIARVRILEDALAADATSK